MLKEPVKVPTENIFFSQHLILKSYQSGLDQDSVLWQQHPKSKIMFLVHTMSN